MSEKVFELPVQHNERVALLDVLRGFALFGVIMVNFNMIMWLETPTELLAQISRPVDDVIDMLQVNLLLHKFVTLFAMLFGYGFGLLLERVEAKGLAAGPFYMRRMAILLLLGAVHLAFWHGDILHAYAVAGMLLLCYRRATDRRVLVHSALLILVVPELLSYVKEYMGMELDTARLHPLFPLFTSTHMADVIIANYTAYASTVRTGFEFEWFSGTLGCVLFGYWCMRKQLFLRLREQLPAVRKVWWLGVVAVLCTGALFLARQAGLLKIAWLGAVLSPIRSIITVGFSLFYSSSVILLHAKGYCGWLFRAFAHVGRMSLTNYITHTVFFVALLYGPGLGLLGKVSYAYGLCFSVCIYAAQVLFSRWWLGRYQYGPVEWVWRQLSYGRRFPLRRASIIQA